MPETCYFYDMHFKCFQHTSPSSSVSRVWAGGSQDFLRLCPQSPLLTLGPPDLLWTPEEQNCRWDKIRKSIMVLSVMPWACTVIPASVRAHVDIKLLWGNREQPQDGGLAGKPEALQHEFGKRATEDMEHLLQQSSEQKSHNDVQWQADGSMALPRVPLASSPSPAIVCCLKTSQGRRTVSVDHLLCL